MRPRLLLTLIALVGTGCASTIALPSDFVRLRDAGIGFRAVTSDDARVWVRDLHDDTAASVEFWAATLQNDCVQQRGYEFVGSGAVKDRAGRDGRWLEFYADVRGERVGYLIAVWVDGNDVTVAEFAAREVVFRARVEAVRAALATVD